MDVKPILSTILTLKPTPITEFGKSLSFRKLLDDVISVVVYTVTIASVTTSGTSALYG